MQVHSLYIQTYAPYTVGREPLFTYSVRTWDGIGICNPRRLQNYGLGVR